MPKKVEVFVSSTCPHCPAAIQVVNEAKNELEAKEDFHDIDVQIKNVEEQENQEKAIGYGIMAVPTIVIDNEVKFIGAPSLTELLDELQ